MPLIVLKMESRNGKAEVEAVRFNGQNGPELAKWCGGTYNISGKFKGPAREFVECVEIPSTYTGNLICFRGAYVVKTPNGPCYPCNSVTFHQMFKEKKG